MRIKIWNRDSGWTFVVLFENKSAGAEYIEKVFKTEAGAFAAGEKFRALKGDNWELGHLKYDRFVPETGEKIPMFRHRNFGQ